MRWRGDDDANGMDLGIGILQLVWPHLLGGCELTRNTAEYLRKAGEWESVDLGAPKGEKWYEPVPYTMGRLVKVGEKK